MVDTLISLISLSFSISIPPFLSPLFLSPTPSFSLLSFSPPPSLSHFLSSPSSLYSPSLPLFLSLFFSLTFSPPPSLSLSPSPSVVGLWGFWRIFKKTPREVRTPHSASQIHALDLLHPLPKHFLKKTADHQLPPFGRSTGFVSSSDAFF